MTNVILCSIGTILAILWMILCIKSGTKYDELVEKIDKNEYFAKELFPIGFVVIEILKIDFNSTIMKKKISKVSELYGIKVAKQLVLTDLAAEITYALTIAPLGFLFAVFANDVTVLIIVFLLIIVLVFYLEYDKDSKVQKRRQDILRDFPHVLSQMALLVNAGMPLRETMEVTASKGKGILHQELRILVDDMQNGIPEYEALSNFAERCGVDYVRKLSSLIIQNVKKGSAELAIVLMELSGEVWRNRVSSVKEEGEKASAKLLVPILIIFVGIIILVYSHPLKQ